MNENDSLFANEVFQPDRFDIGDLQDEIRVDELCGRLLRLFYQDLVEDEKLAPEEAGAMAHGADYFLREFIIPDRRENIFRVAPHRVRQFAGNWYIVRNIEPNMRELTGILRGVEAFYRYCHKIGKVSAEVAARIEEQARDLPFYGRRIESFWEITGGGYFAWEAECSLKD